MTFPIDTTIPAANNAPADDQPKIQNNFANINSYLQVDHTNPAAVNAGFHKQITFPANNVPLAFPVTPPILFTNNQDGAGNVLPGSVSELFFYSGIQANSKNQYVATANGSTLVLGGIVLKWGAINPANNGTTYNFPVAFPTNCFCVQVTINIASTVIPIGINGFTNTGFTFRSNVGTGVPILYFAIGN